MDVNISTRMLLDLSNVKRWSAVRTIKTQNVAEHVFGVMVAARWLAKRAWWDKHFTFVPIGDAAGMAQVYHCVLEHDGIESLSGDMPAPFKAAMLPQLSEIERRAVDDKYSSTVLTHVKVADYLEALAFLSSEQAMGNTSVDPVVEDLEVRVEALGVGRALLDDWYAEIDFRDFPVLQFAKPKDDSPAMESEVA